MDSASAKILMDMYFPVLARCVVLATGFQYLRHRRAKGKTRKPVSAFRKIIFGFRAER